MLGGIDGDTSNDPTFRADLTPSRAWTGGRVTEPRIVTITPAPKHGYFPTICRHSFRMLLINEVNSQISLRLRTPPVQTVHKAV